MACTPGSFGLELSFLVKANAHSSSDGLQPSSAGHST